MKQRFPHPYPTIKEVRKHVLDIRSFLKVLRLIDKEVSLGKFNKPERVEEVFATIRSLDLEVLRQVFYYVSDWRHKEVKVMLTNKDFLVEFATGKGVNDKCEIIPILGIAIHKEGTTWRHAFKLLEDDTEGVEL